MHYTSIIVAFTVRAAGVRACYKVINLSVLCAVSYHVYAVLSFLLSLISRTEGSLSLADWGGEGGGSIKTQYT